MTKRYYECHLTIQGSASDKDFIKKTVEAIKWKFSAIDGDPSLGDGVKFYATRHFNAKLLEAYILKRLRGASMAMAASCIRVVREKIELVIHDTRSSTVRCDGGCPECHLDEQA